MSRNSASAEAVADSHESGRLNAASQRALVADGSLRTVRNILARDLDRDEDEPCASAADGAFLHGQQQLLEGTRS